MSDIKQAVVGFVGAAPLDSDDFLKVGSQPCFGGFIAGSVLTTNATAG